jgi:hypothetical protein
MLMGLRAPANQRRVWSVTIASGRVTASATEPDAAQIAEDADHTRQNNAHFARAERVGSQAPRDHVFSGCWRRWARAHIS